MTEAHRGPRRRPPWYVTCLAQSARCVILFNGFHDSRLFKVERSASEVKDRAAIILGCNHQMFLGGIS
jgi:hypothetical protein